MLLKCVDWSTFRFIRCTRLNEEALTRCYRDSVNRPLGWIFTKHGTSDFKPNEHTRRGWCLSPRGFGSSRMIEARLSPGIIFPQGSFQEWIDKKFNFYSIHKPFCMLFIVFFFLANLHSYFPTNLHALFYRKEECKTSRKKTKKLINFALLNNDEWIDTHETNNDKEQIVFKENVFNTTFHWNN